MVLKGRCRSYIGPGTAGKRVTVGFTTVCDRWVRKQLFGDGSLQVAEWNNVTMPEVAGKAIF